MKWWYWLLLALVGTLTVVVSVLVINRSLTPLKEQPCNAGECLSNIITGEKRCSTTDGELRPSFVEVCNPKRSCTNKDAPYLMYDKELGTDLTGVCPASVSDKDCACSPLRFCPNEISTYFVEVERSAYGWPVANGATRTSSVYVMNDTYRSSLVSEAFYNDTPLAINTQSTLGVCTLSKNNIDRIWPQDEFITKNKCLSGRLVYEQEGNVVKCVNREELADLDCTAPRRIIVPTTGDVYCGILS